MKCTPLNDFIWRNTQYCKTWPDLEGLGLGMHSCSPRRRPGQASGMWSRKDGDNHKTTTLYSNFWDSGFPSSREGRLLVSCWPHCQSHPSTLRDLCSLAPRAASVGTRLAYEDPKQRHHPDGAVLSHLPCTGPCCCVCFHTINSRGRLPHPLTPVPHVILMG